MAPRLFAEVGGEQQLQTVVDCHRPVIQVNDTYLQSCLVDVLRMAICRPVAAVVFYHEGTSRLAVGVLSLLLSSLLLSSSRPFRLTRVSGFMPPRTAI